MDRHAVLAAAGPAQRFAVPPEPAKTGDGNEWVTGRCWLYCLRDGVQVIWIGPVQVVGATAPAYGCGPCVRVLCRQRLNSDPLTNLVWDSLTAKDRPTPAPAP